MQDSRLTRRDAAAAVVAAAAAVAAADKRYNIGIDDFSSRSPRTNAAGTASDALKFYRSLFNEDTARSTRDALNH